MALAEFKVTNVSNGRLELRPYRIVLGPGESVKLAAPLDENINWLIGRRLAKLEPLASAREARVQPFTVTEPPRPAEPKPGRRRDRDNS